MDRDLIITKLQQIIALKDDIVRLLQVSDIPTPTPDPIPDPTPTPDPVPTDPLTDGGFLGTRYGAHLVCREFYGKKWVTEIANLGEGKEGFLVRGANILHQEGVSLANSDILNSIDQFEFKESGWGGVGAPSEQEFPTPSGYYLFVFEDGARAYVKGSQPVDPTPVPTPDPIPTPVDPSPAVGNEFPEYEYQDAQHLNEFDPLSIPKVQWRDPLNNKLNVAEIEYPYGKVLPEDKVAALLRHATQVPPGTAYRDPRYSWTEDQGAKYDGVSPLQPQQLAQMHYQQNVMGEGWSQNPNYNINWMEVYNRIGDFNEAAIRLNRKDYLEAHKVAMKAIFLDFEWGSAWGDGNNEDHAIYVMMCEQISKHKPDFKFLFGPFYQSAKMAWGTSGKELFNARNPAFFKRVERSPALENGNYPEHLYGKCVADYCNTGSTECYPVYEDRFPDGYQVVTREGQPVYTQWGPYKMERSYEQSRHWIGNFVGVIEQYHADLPDFLTHVNLGLYNLGGSGYQTHYNTWKNNDPSQGRALSGMPDYWVPKPNQGDPGNDAWGLHRPIPRFHCEGYAALSVFSGVDLVTLWCNDPGSLSGEKKPLDSPWTDDVMDFRPYEWFKRELVRLYNTKVTVNGQSIGINDVIDGAEEFLLHNTEAKYSGLTKTPHYGDDRHDGRGDMVTYAESPEGTFHKFDVVDRKVLKLPYVTQVVNRNKRLIATLGIKSYTSDMDTTITTRFEGKEINSFRLRDDQVMVRIDQY